MLLLPFDTSIVVHELPQDSFAFLAISVILDFQAIAGEKVG